MKKTIFLDIDGTLVEHKGNLHNLMIESPVILEGVIERLNEWEAAGYNIILTTGRKESQRNLTERQLEELGIFYDMLIMGIGGGPRYVINDRKPDGRDTAFAINIERNKGLKNVSLDDVDFGPQKQPATTGQITAQVKLVKNKLSSR